MILTFAGELTKMIDAGLGRESAAPDTGVAVGRYSEYVEVSDTAIATFDTNAALPLRALSVNIEPIQEGTGDPSPENVRPITGRQNVTVTRAGKNLCSGIYLGGIDDDGQEIPGSNGITDFIKIGDIRSITISGMNDSNYNTRVYQYDRNKNFLSSISVTVGAATSVTFSLVSGVEYIRAKASSNKLVPGSDVQFEFGSSATAYEPYNGDMIGFGTSETIYGGVLDAVNGTLTVTHRYVTEDDFSIFSNSTNAGGLHWADISDAAATTAGESFCSMLIRKDGNAGWASSTPCYAINTSGAIRVYCTESTFSDFKAAYSELQIVFPLATHLTIQLAPQQIETLIGTNNVWSDGGNVSLTYTKYNYTEGY